MNEESQERQVDTLIYLIGQEAENAFWSVDSEERKDYDKVEQGFDSYFQPKTNAIHEMRKFGQRVQVEGEPIEAYIRALHAMQKDAIMDKIKTRTFVIEWISLTLHIGGRNTVSHLKL